MQAGRNRPACGSGACFAGGAGRRLSCCPRSTGSAELIERVVALLDEVALAPERQEPARARRLCCRNTIPVRPAVDGWVAFVSSPDGYRLLPAGRTATRPREPCSSSRAAAFVVLRLGPSPLPGDRRRCAFLERKEPPSRGANLRPVKEQSQIDDMRAAIQGDRERAEQARQRSTENVRALIEPA